MGAADRSDATDGRPMTTYSLIPASDAAHQQLTDQRFDDLNESGRAQRRALLIESQIDVNAETRLFQQASATPSIKKKLFWLHCAADVISSAVERSGAAACRDGCSHCCHIAVMISAPEARLLAKSTGRTMVAVPARSIALSIDDLKASGEQIDEIRAETTAAFTGVPCPFLKDNSCSVYADRPLACRYQVSLDDDDLLCQLVEGTNVRVPYLDNSTRTLAATVILGPTQRIADIRDWFPDTPESAS